MNGTTTVAIPEKEQWKQNIQKFNDKEYLVLAPIELGPIPAMHTPMASVVKIDPDPSQGDVYTLQGKFAYSKSALDRVAAAAGISWLPEMCGRTDSGSDPDVVRFRMAGKRKELDGQWRIVVREYEFDLKAREEELKDKKDIIQMRKFKVQRAESGAASRVVRVFLGIKSNYTREQIARPMIVPKLVFTPDYSDPEVKRFMLAEATGTIPELYGAQAGAGTFSNPIVIQESPEEVEEQKRIALPLALENGAEKPATDKPSSAGETAGKVEEPPPPDAVLQFEEAYQQETKAGNDQVKYAAIADQCGALKSLMERKGATLKQGWTIEKLTRDQRKEWCGRLQAMPDVQAGLPWDEKQPGLPDGKKGGAA